MKIKICPRCGKEFECHHDDDISLCQCAGIKITPGMQLHMQLHYNNECLCIDCLRSLKKIFPIGR